VKSLLFFSNNQSLYGFAFSNFFSNIAFSYSAYLFLSSFFIYIIYCLFLSFCSKIYFFCSNNYYYYYIKVSYSDWILSCFFFLSCSFYSNSNYYFINISYSLFFLFYSLSSLSFCFYSNISFSFYSFFNLSYSCYYLLNSLNSLFFLSSS